MKYCVVSGSSCMFGDAPNSQILSFNSWNHICFVRITNKGETDSQKRNVHTWTSDYFSYHRAEFIGEFKEPL